MPWQTTPEPLATVSRFSREWHDATRPLTGRSADQAAGLLLAAARELQRLARQRQADEAKDRRAREHLAQLRRLIAARFEQLRDPAAVARALPHVPEATVMMVCRLYLARHASLAREREVMRRARRGETNGEIAEALGISTRTVSRTIRRVLAQTAR